MMFPPHSLAELDKSISLVRSRAKLLYTLRTAKVSCPPILEGNVTKCVPHAALLFTSAEKLTFDERSFQPLSRSHRLCLVASLSRSLVLSSHPHLTPFTRKPNYTVPPI